MTAEQSIGDKEYIRRALEVTIYIGLVLVLIGACFRTARPFLSLIAWGVIIAISIYPWFERLQRALGGRRGVAAVNSSIAPVADGDFRQARQATLEVVN